MPVCGRCGKTIGAMTWICPHCAAAGATYPLLRLKLAMLGVSTIAVLAC